VLRLGVPCSWVYMCKLSFCVVSMWYMFVLFCWSNVSFVFLGVCFCLSLHIWFVCVRECSFYGCVFVCECVVYV